MLYWKPSAASLAAAAVSPPEASAGPAGPAGPARPPSDLAAVVSVHPAVVSAVNVTSINFIGLALLHARGNGIDVSGSKHVHLLNCIIANHGELAVNFTNSSMSSISGCRVEQTGSGGVNLEGTATRFID